MTNDEKITALRAMLGDTDDNDTVLSVYLQMAGQKIINRAYPYKADVTEVPAMYEPLQIEIALYLMNKRGAEGQLTHSENGISRSYENGDVPNSMLKQVTPYVGIIG